jgi:SAM-dependent methyltransferase
MQASIEILLQKIANSITAQTFIKIVLGNKRNKAAELKNVSAKLITIKEEPKLSFVYRYPTKDVTKNFSVKEGIALIEQLLQQEFLNADLFTSSNNTQFFINEKGMAKMTEKAVTASTTPTLQTHDKQKQYAIKADNNIYLQALGITGADGHVKKDKQDKYRQLNHYIEIIDGIVKDLQLQPPINIADMGSGKGYLTFALYDYLHHKMQLSATVTGIELREELVNICNDIASKAGYLQLHFKTGSIASANVDNIDILIALHACDTATDDAIYKGIKASAKVIVCAPCCHKQIRRQMKPIEALTSITKHGILLERQAEMVTDSIRALILEMNGYKTKVFEFIATEHTPKNVLIVGTKRETGTVDKADIAAKIAALKNLFGIEEHYLEGFFK